MFRFDREPDSVLGLETQSKPYAMMAAEPSSLRTAKRPRLNSADVSPLSKIAATRKCTFDFSAKKPASKHNNSSSSDASGQKRKRLIGDPALDAISQRED